MKVVMKVVMGASLSVRAAAAFAIGFAAFCGPAGAADQTVTASVNGVNYSGIVVEIRTSDIGAKAHICTTGSTGGCSVSDNQSSIPKNIGNMLCLPFAMGSYQIDPTCQTLLNEVSGCQKNSAVPYCATGSSNQQIRPYCNYRTSENAGTQASWSWQLVYDAGNKLTVQCSKTGYQGVSK